MADEARLHSLLDLVEQSRKEGDKETEAKATAAYRAESTVSRQQYQNGKPTHPGMSDARGMGQRLTDTANEALGGVVEPAVQMLSGAAATGVGILGKAAAPLTNAVGATDVNPQDVKDIAQEQFTYHPVTETGKQVSKVLGYVPGKILDVVGKVSPEAQDAAEMAMIVAPLKGLSKSAVPGNFVKTKGDLEAPHTAGAVTQIKDLFTKEGQARIQTRQQQQLIGSPVKQKVVIKALDNPKPSTPGSQQTAAQILADVPEGSPIRAHEAVISRQPGGISAEFEQRKLDQAAAKESVETARGNTTDTMREKSIELANAGKTTHTLETTVDAPNKAITVKSKNGATLAVKRGDTLQTIRTNTAKAGQGLGEATAREMEMADAAVSRGLSLTSDTQVSAAAAKVYNNLEKRGYPVKRNPSTPDENGTLHSDNGLPVFEVGARPKGVPVRPIIEKINNILNNPKFKTEDAIKVTQEAVKEKLLDHVSEDGLIDANLLDSARLQIGEKIGAYTKNRDNSPRSRRLAAKLLIPLKQAIVGSLEGANSKGEAGTGYKAYVEKYATESEKANADLARDKLLKKPVHRTTISGGQVAQVTPHIPNPLYRPAMVANAALRMLGRNVEPKLAAIAADRYLNPAKLSDALKKAAPKAEIPPGGSFKKQIGTGLTGVSSDERQRRLRAEALRQ